MRAVSRSIEVLLDRLRVNALIDIALARREMLRALRRGLAIPPAEPIPDAVLVERVIARAGRCSGWRSDRSGPLPGPLP